MLKKIATTVKNSFQAIVRGEFLMRLGITRYFAQIVYVFFLLGCIIWISLLIDNTMKKVEDNKATIKDLEIEYTMDKFEIEKHKNRDFILDMLKAQGSAVGEPETPATALE